MPNRTAAEQAELVAKLIENVSDVIAVIDQNGTISFQSPSVERTLGYLPEELDGTIVFELVHPDDTTGAWLRMSQVLTEPGSTRPSLIRLRHRDRSWRMFEAVGTAMFDDPLVRGIVVTARDVTDRIRLEEELRQTQKMEAIGRLAGGVAHDFNNLITAITGYAGFILERLEPGDPSHLDAQAIAEAAERAARLTRQLLSFSRRQVLEVQSLDLNEIVAGMELMLRRLIGEQIEFVTVLDADLGPVRADPGQIEQVILNLALNARDAMAGGGALTIETRNVDADSVRGSARTGVGGDAHLLLAVSDTGPGIDEQTREHLFEPFYTTKGEGTGLGLATVYGIVEQAGGFIEVESVPGRGSTFGVHLPVDREPLERFKPQAAEPRRESANETILIVEDEDLVRALARRVLEHNGYRVLEASSPLAALTLSSGHEGPIDLLLTDVVMPGMSGKRLAEQLVATRPQLRTLFMSGYSDDAIAEHGVEGAWADVDFIAKPFAVEHLVEKVREALDHQQAVPDAHRVG
jgi:two-component system, cell cycle sensor histidine kinase and response regulator CckA